MLNRLKKKLWITKMLIKHYSFITIICFEHSSLLLTAAMKEIHCHTNKDMSEGSYFHNKNITGRDFFKIFVMNRVQIKDIRISFSLSNLLSFQYLRSDDKVCN